MLIVLERALTVAAVGAKHAGLLLLGRELPVFQVAQVIAHVFDLLLVLDDRLAEALAWARTLMPRPASLLYLMRLMMMRLLVLLQLRLDRINGGRGRYHIATS